MKRKCCYVAIFWVVMALLCVPGCTKKAGVKEPLSLPATTDKVIADPVQKAPSAADRALQEETIRDKALKEQTLKEEEKQSVPAEKATVSIADLQDIYFDYDQAALKQEDRDILLNHAEWLKKNPAYRVVIEGHCDERGTTDYNLALGERRAQAVLKFLVDLGVERSRLEAVSFGKEKPLNPDHTEDAWAKNRRVHFVLQK